MNIAYLILGSNKGDRSQNLKAAVMLMNKAVGRVVKTSDVFVTAAWGNTNQPDFYNQAVQIDTLLTADQLLESVLAIEIQLGRTRTDKKWEQRTMDIDILFFNDEVINTPDLTIPHPYIQERKFVLMPLNQIAPDFVHPKLKVAVKSLLDGCIDVLSVGVLKDVQ